MSKHPKRVRQPWTSWLQDGGDEAQMLLVEILDLRIEEDDVPQTLQDDIAATCEQLVSLIGQAREEAKERREAREADEDPYEGLRHSQHERLG